MSNVSSVGNPWVPNPGHLNKLTVNMIKDKDADGDEALNVKELGLPEDIFTKIDTDGDGNASRTELNTYYPISKIDIPTLGLIKNNDANGDKLLTAEELGVSEDVFAKIDTSGDGKTDREELNAAHPLSALSKSYKDILDMYKNKEGSNGGVDVTV